MSSGRHRAAFTLIEVLVVVAIVAVLAAVMMPQVANVTEDAKASSLRHNLFTLRAQIEMYKLTHAGAVPQLSGGTLTQLTSATDATGATGPRGPLYPLGPYIAAFPANPFDDKKTVTATATFPPTATTSDGGWLYHQASGQIAPNTSGHLND